MSYIFLNGKFISSKSAKISIHDSGFLYGDSVYEVIPIFNNNLFKKNEHLQRLFKSLNALSINHPIINWDYVLNNMLDINDISGSYVYIQVTRGTNLTRSPAFNINSNIPTVLIAIYPIHHSKENASISVTTEIDNRWKLQSIKANTLLPNILALHQGIRNGADDIIFVKNGYAYEGAFSNLFIVKNKVIMTPPTNGSILPGITRQVIIKIIKKEKIQIYEKMISIDELNQADEIWLTSSTINIRSITRLNNTPISDGNPGPMWKKISMLLEEMQEN